MLEFISHSWLIWLTLSVGLPFLLALRHVRQAEQRHTLENIEEFHLAAFYHPSYGEGVSLVGFVLGIVSFSFFLIGVLRWFVMA